MAKPRRGSGAGRHAHRLPAIRDELTGPHLPASAQLRLAVHGDLTALDDGPRGGAVVDQACQLQQLTEPDRLVTNGNLGRGAHAAILRASADGSVSWRPGRRWGDPRSGP